MKGVLVQSLERERMSPSGTTGGHAAIVKDVAFNLNPVYVQVASGFLYVILWELEFVELE